MVFNCSLEKKKKDFYFLFSFERFVDCFDGEERIKPSVESRAVRSGERISKST